MNWKNFLCVTLLTGAVMAAAVGCQAASTVTTTTAQTTAQANETTQPPASANAPSTVKPTQPNGTMFPPPSGNVTGNRPVAPTMNLADAATKLGVTVQQLSDALGNTQQDMPDFTTVAQKLGVTEQALREALGVDSFNGTMPGGPGGVRPSTVPNTTSK